ncbi:MAG: NUDIX hydrolase [Sulfuricurvum sp.]|uniref:NUDIX hydrolase n=1 Tax=Sulfuricurvum sp. TaxID=2025608 RepID=UPI002620A62D|nr:NUDIX hydrolase [Sulfuricurvum sp.]MDD2951296.1 NUDIX hydrolase [Sulfuricurvum sp.]MDD5117377.1 NUDIX hydrolase [Sulfuricurvum sp.]
MIQTPFLAVDGIVEIYSDTGNFEGIVLIERLNTPKGLALPGGFVDIGESVETAVEREMKEEISLDVTRKSLLGVYSDPTRDSRFHCVSIVFICKASGTPIGADDAKEAFVYRLDDIPYEKLVFDHAQILRDYCTRKQN